ADDKDSSSTGLVGGRLTPALAIAAHLGAAAANLHLAPAPASISRPIDKEPTAAAAGADLYARELAPAQNLAPGPSNGAEELGRARWLACPGPGVAIAKEANPRTRHGFR